MYHWLMGQQVSPLEYKREQQLANARRWLELRPQGLMALPFYVREGLEGMDARCSVSDLPLAAAGRD